MLSRKFRVKRQSFRDLIKKGRVFHCEIFTIRYSKAIHSTPRFGVVVPKSVSKSAAARNLLKRRMWACIAENQADIIPGLDIVFFMKKNSNTVSFSNLERQFSVALNTSKLTNRSFLHNR